MGQPFTAGGSGGGDISGVGQFGTRGSLPTDPGEIDPPILTSGGSYTRPTASDYWTRIDPNMGYIDPTLNIDPSQGSGLYREQTGQLPAQIPTATPGAMGPFPGGNMNGPQGSVYGINPVTGNTIYNVTGSPRPGFFDSTAGKVVKGVGSTALNMFVPGLGFVSGRILEAIRNRQAAKNTGTDLSGRQRTSTGQNTPSGPAWHQPGYQLPVGIQSAITSGAYQRAYGTSPQLAASHKIMSSQAYGGNPNRVPKGTGEEGNFKQFDPRLGVSGYIDDQGVLTTQRFAPATSRRPDYNAGAPPLYGSTAGRHGEWLAQQPAHIKFMADLQARGGFDAVRAAALRRRGG